MAIVPTNLARVSNTLRTSVTTQTLAKTQQQLLQVQNELSTGYKIWSPSQDPGSASIIMQLQKMLENRQAYLDNISHASGQLAQVDSTISDIQDKLLQAQSIASANVGSDVSDQQRADAATVIQSIYAQMLAFGNSQYNGQYLFAGEAGGKAPFVEASNGVQFVGSDGQLSNSVDGNTVMSFTTAASDVFGQLSARVAGSAVLNPQLTASTRLSDLAGATGNSVRLGSIVLSDGVTSKTIDLTGADTIGDVVTRINSAGVGGITAAVDPVGGGIALAGSGADNITVTESGGGTTASDLGILRTTGLGGGVPLTGSSVGAKLTEQSALANINGGALDLASGLIITNGQQTATLNFSSDTTVGDLIRRINSAGVGVRAEINAAGTGIDIVNTIQGAGLTIGENGGNTAASLGIRTLGGSTRLASLNGGNGVHLATGADLRITQMDGVTIDVDLDGTQTINDVIAAINAAASGAGSGLTASLATTGNGIVITDVSGGVGQTSVASLNGSTAAKDLGLTGTAVGGVVTGTDVNPVAPSGIFAHLAALRDALQKGDQAAITAATDALKADYDRTVQTHGQVGAKEQELQERSDRIDSQNVATTAALSGLRDTDYTDAITRFQTLQTALQAALQSAGQTLNMSLLDFLR